MPLTMATPIFGRELPGGEIVEEEQRLGALDDDVVDAHRDEIDADRVVDAGLDGDLHLGADAVIGRDQDRILKAGRLEIEQAAEAADLRIGARPARGAHQRLDLHPPWRCRHRYRRPLARRSGRSALGIRSSAHPRSQAREPESGGRRQGIRTCREAREGYPASQPPFGQCSTFAPGGRHARPHDHSELSSRSAASSSFRSSSSMIVQGRWAARSCLFVVAGVSDAVDGFIARRFDMRSELGAYLDPLADKALLVSIYVTLRSSASLPGWLAIVVVSRDVMIVAAVLLVLDHGPAGRDQAARCISKVNTAVADRLCGPRPRGQGLRVSISRGFERSSPCWIVAALTVASAGAYLAGWLRHMAA